MTRAELWKQTDSNVTAWLGHASEPGERSDDFVAVGVTAHYWDGACRELMTFPRLQHMGICPIELDGEDISDFTRADVVTFLELREWDRQDGYEDITVPSQGLTFWFREAEDEEASLEFVRVNAVTGD